MLFILSRFSYLTPLYIKNERKILISDGKGDKLKSEGLGKTLYTPLGFSVLDRSATGGQAREIE